METILETIDNLLLLIERGAIVPNIGENERQNVRFMLVFHRRAITCGATPEASVKTAWEWIGQLEKLENLNKSSTS